MELGWHAVGGGWMAVLMVVTGLAGTAEAPCLAGELEPSVVPGTPTMKPIDQLEPWMAI